MMLCTHRKTKRITEFYLVDYLIGTNSVRICLIVLDNKGVDGWSETPGTFDVIYAKCIHNFLRAPRKGVADFKTM